MADRDNIRETLCKHPNQTFVTGKKEIQTSSLEKKIYTFVYNFISRDLNIYVYMNYTFTMSENK